MLNWNINLSVYTAINLYVSYINNFLSYKIHNYFRFSRSNFIYSICLLDKLLKSGKIVIKQSTIHRITLVVLLLSNKMLEDNIYNNRSWSIAGGVTLKNINELEKYVLEALDYRLHVTLEEYDSILYLFKMNKEYKEYNEYNECNIFI